MQLKKHLFFLPLLFAFIAPLIPNFKEVYFPSRNYGPSKEFLKKVADGFDSLITIESFDGRGQKKMIKEAFKGSKKELLSLDTAQLLMRNDTITGYLQGLVNHIQQKNPMLQGKRFTVFTLRTDEPNAANWGAGVILFNLDLITKMRTEDEIAFVLCHEISHDIKGHVVHSMQERYTIIHSEEFKKEVRKIKNEEFNKFKRIEALLTKFISKDSKSNRTKELEADSLGLVLFCNAGYSAYHSLRVMHILDSADNPAYTNKIDYMKHFNFASYPFKNSWFEEDQEETIAGGNMAESLPDSLKTHPDCKIRLTALQRIAKRNNYNLNKPASTNNRFGYFGTRAYLELVEHSQSEYDLSFALYNSLQLLSMYPDNAYVKCSVANCLYEIYVSKVDHYMSQVVDMPDKKTPAEYKQMLVLLHNINSETTRNILLNYYEKNIKGKINNTQSGYLATLISSIDMPKKDREKLITEYKKKHNDLYYLDLLTRKFKPKK